MRTTRVLERLLPIKINLRVAFDVAPTHHVCQFSPFFLIKKGAKLNPERRIERLCSSAERRLPLHFFGSSNFFCQKSGLVGV
jgi:hypothetical protein